MEKLNGFAARRTNAVKGLRNQTEHKKCYDYAAQFYKKRESENLYLVRKKAEYTGKSQETSAGSKKPEWMKIPH